MAKDLQNINEQEFRDMNTEEKILQVSGNYVIPNKKTKEEAYHALRKKIADNEAKKGKIITLRRYMAYAAAAAVLLIGAWILWPGNSMENVVVEKGQQTDFKLPDGSLVLLNADTKISFDKNKFDKKRSLQMEGEAFFNVEKGSRFTIATDLADIEILGTSFNVYARDNQFSVSCFTGKILVKNNATSVIILPGQTAYIDNDKLEVRKEENINATAAWRVGEFSFENTPLNLVLNEVERQFNVTFVVPNLDDKKFTGSFSNKNLVDALDIICIPMGLTYEIKSNGKIFIANKSK